MEKVYPLFKSSKRSVQEIYGVITGGYSKKDESITPLIAVMKIIESIPNLTYCYDITKVKDQEEDDPNHFKLVANLCRRQFQDPNNIFNTPGMDNLDESVNLRPFTYSKSITSWNTSASQGSSLMDIPPVIEAPNDT